MRALCGLLVLTGIALLMRPWWPAAFASAPAWLGWWLGLGCIALGLLPLGWRLVRGPELDDRVVRRELRRRRFHVIALDRGWQAEGDWDGIPVILRREEGYQASRFGRPWILVLRCPGAPLDPWPLDPREARLIEVGTDAFSVALSESSILGRQHLIAERIDQALRSRRDPR